MPTIYITNKILVRTHIHRIPTKWVRRWPQRVSFVMFAGQYDVLCTRSYKQLSPLSRIEEFGGKVTPEVLIREIWGIPGLHEVMVLCIFNFVCNITLTSIKGTWHERIAWQRWTWKSCNERSTSPIFPKPFRPKAGHAEHTPVDKNSKFRVVVPSRECSIV